MPSFLEKMASIAKLKNFLTPKNLELLDAIFEGLTITPESSRTFWVWFASQKDWDAVEYSIGTLIELRTILNDYRGVPR